LPDRAERVVNEMAVRRREKSIRATALYWRHEQGAAIRAFMCGGPQYGASPRDIDILEASLIHDLNPPANDREDDTRHPLLAHSDRLLADLLG